MRILFYFALLSLSVHGCPYLSGNKEAIDHGVENPHNLSHSSKRQRRLQRTAPPAPDGPGGPPPAPDGPGGPPPAPPSPSTPPSPAGPPSFQGTVPEAIAAARADITNIISDDHEPFMGPKFVRLAFHDCVGGCNGCVNMEKIDNRGLEEPINRLTGLVDKYSNQLTRADMWMLAAVQAASHMQKHEAVDYEFNYVGRASCPDPMGGVEPNMPSPHLSTQGILNFFENQFGFNDQETVAIMGAHTLGVLDRNNSGFEGSWVPAETNLDNEYFTFIVGGNSIETARPLSRFEQELQGNSETGDQFLWRFTGDASGGLRGRKLQKTSELVMLNVDMSLVANFAGYIDDSNGSITCALRDTPDNTLDECPHASTLAQAAAYKYDNTLFLNDFRDVLTKMTLNGHSTDHCETFPCTLQ